MPEYDESCAARIAAEHLKKSFAVHGLNHHVKMADPSDFSLLEFLSVRFGEPYADASMLPTLLLSRFSREFVTVALSGDGADEFFGGYERYIAMNCMRKIRPVPKSLLKAASALLPSGGERSRMGRLKRFLVCASEDPQKQYESIVTHRGRSVLQLFASPELRNASEQLDKGFDCSEENLCCLHTAQDIAEFCMEEDVHNYLPGDILVKTDTCSMAASLELRSPFLDHHVAEFAASLPVEWKLEGKKRKRILMDAFRKYLPCDPEKIRKRGFGVPLALWFRTCWNAKMKEHLLDPSFADGVFVERSGIERMIKDHEQGRADYSPMIFSLLMFCLLSIGM